uniref:pre-mRNA-splicing factor CWC22 homolog n=1 Tax=Erigeron canadensis TaxID=72917 RepID=UPI001CB8EF8D|nr:pre-mRNA-splicing factor CWC22 homolog [Erigeron canadensis]
MERQRERSDEEERYKRRRDGDRYRSERDSRDRRISNKSDDEGGYDRRRDRDGERRKGDSYTSDRSRKMNRDDGRRRTSGRSDDEDVDEKRGSKDNVKGSDDEDDGGLRRGRRMELRGDHENGTDRKRRSGSDESEDSDTSNRKRRQDSDEEGEIRKTVDKRGEKRDGDVGDTRKTLRKGMREDGSDEEDGEIRKRGRKGKREDRSDEEDGKVRKRGRKGMDRRSDDEDDRKDRRRRDRKKHMSDDEDDKFKRRRGRKKDMSDDEDDSFKRRDRNRNGRDDDEDDSRRRDGKDRRSNGDHKGKRSDDAKNDQNGDKEKVDEGPRFQKLAEMQEGMTNLGKSGGVYIPPFKLARMMSEVQDKSSTEYQRMTWDALKKSINGLVNKVNATNIKNIIPELFAENLIRGRGLFCRSCMKSQMASPGFTDVFAALVAVVNTKFPEVGDLLLRRIILQLQRAYKRNDKHQLLAAVKFIAHLVNQQVAHEIIALELLTTLLENPTDDSVEVAVGFVTECGSILQDLTPKGLHGIFERFRGILHEGEIDKRVQFLIEGLFALRKAKFQGHPAVRPELDLVELEDQVTREVSLLDEIDPETGLDIFKFDPDFIEHEKRYEALKKDLLGDESFEDEDDDGADSDDEDDESSEEEDEEQMRIRDETETNLVNLRRTIYLTIMSSVDFEEAGHKLLKIKLEPGQEMELCVMLLECCSQERTYLRYYGLLGQRFCMINKVHQENFEKCFVEQYSMIHRLETNKLRNVAKFFAHLLGTDALPWHVLAYIRLTEEDTTSSSRIFIKILFQELSEHLGIRLLNERLSDPTMQADFESIFPRDNPKNTRFSINFFTSIGLGGITENLREYLKNMPRLIMQQKPVSESDNSGSSSSGSESSSSESESESDSSLSDHKKSSKHRRRR